MNKLGIMQGRLSTPPSKELQVFPWATWRDEFQSARAVGLDLIEWLFDLPDHGENPIWSSSGRDEIRRITRDTGVSVDSICAHYFIRGQLSAVDRSVRESAIGVLRQLIEAGADIGAHVLVLPLAEEASLRAPQARTAALESLACVADTASQAGVKLALELDLNAAGSLDLLRDAGSAAVGVCYDLGNATSAGLVPSEEIQQLGGHVFEVHIKDRRLHGPNVPLGAGGVDFDAARESVLALGYDGPLVMETPRGDHPVVTARRHVDFVRQHFAPVQVRPLP
jgi:L-ribulose-5-phosphate 3-epimerase